MGIDRIADAVGWRGDAVTRDDRGMVTPANSNAFLSHVALRRTKQIQKFQMGIVRRIPSRPGFPPLA